MVHLDGEVVVVRPDGAVRLAVVAALVLAQLPVSHFGRLSGVYVNYFFNC